MRRDEAIHLIADDDLVKQVQRLHQVQAWCNAQEGDYRSMSCSSAEWGTLDKLMKSMLSKWIAQTFDVEDGDYIAVAVMDEAYSNGESIAYNIHQVTRCAGVFAGSEEICDECIGEAVSQYREVTLARLDRK